MGKTKSNTAEKKSTKATNKKELEKQKIESDSEVESDNEVVDESESENDVDEEEAEIEVEVPESMEKKQLTFESLFEEINQDDEEILDQLLPENIEVTSYYLKIADLIYTWHYRLDSISIQDSSKGGDGLRAGQESMGSKENLKSIAINISVSEGTYENMKTLLKQIEKTMPLMDITNFTSGAPGFGDHSITMQTYYLKNTNVNKEEKTE